MRADDYRRFTDELVVWGEQTPEVVGLVAVGSTAAVTHEPDVWSDHDVFVVTEPGRSGPFLADPGWLPDAGRIVVWHGETPDGRGAVYDDGHLVELAVFEDGALPDLSVNDYRVLVGPQRLHQQLAAMEGATSRRASADDPTGTRRFRAIVVQLVIGLGRDARGETLSAHERIRGRALADLLSLVRDFRAPETDAPLDNLDPYRRMEAAHPTIAHRLAAALDQPLPAVVETMLQVLEDELGDAVPGVSESVAAVRALASRV